MTITAGVRLGPAAILRDEPPALESAQQGIPASLEAVVRRCLAKRPADRYSSGRAVEAALEAVLASLEPGRVSAARPVGSRGPTRPPPSCRSTAPPCVPSRASPPAPTSSRSPSHRAGDGWPRPSPAPAPRRRCGSGTSRPATCTSSTSRRRRPRTGSRCRSGASGRSAISLSSGSRRSTRGGGGGIRRWNLDERTQELVFAARPGYGLAMRLGAEGAVALVRPLRLDFKNECFPVELVDLRAGTSRALPEFGECVPHIWGFALDASGTIAATADRDGLVRVGRVGAGEPHLLVGHDGAVMSVALSPDLRWVASAGDDDTLRLWPMPDLDQPPLHTLPHEELLAKLKSLTNLRAVRDSKSATGWTIETGPFPGWETVPTW